VVFVASSSLRHRIQRSKYLLILFLPGLAYYILFKYLPMFGIIIAFQDFSVYDGFLGSTFVGFKHFISFFRGPYFWLLLNNTLILNALLITFGFPAAILLALLINEMRSIPAKRFVQTVSYLPHFVSTVVVVGMVLDFLSPRTGLISLLIGWLTGQEPIFYMASPKYFRPVYVITELWKNTGWNTIIYIAALAGIDPTLYEAALVDGANRFQRTMHVTLPGILPTLIIVFILRIGYVLEVGFEMAFLMQNSLNFDTSEVISTFVYRRGIAASAGADFSFASAVGLFQSFIGFAMIVITNRLAKRFGDISLW
jgi:putative aldouronate transport system permease protein